MSYNVLTGLCGFGFLVCVVSIVFGVLDLNKLEHEEEENEELK